MTIINPNNMPYTPADKPTVTTVSKTTTSITYSITNPNLIQAKIFYEIGDDTPDANNITLAGGASQNVTVSGLITNTSYILYTQAFTATGYSLVGNYSETTLSSGLYDFNSQTFTNAGVTGRIGPTLTQCRTAYNSESWTQNNSFFNMTIQGIQEWTVPVSGTYRIEAWGAQGGVGTGGGGQGAKMQGDFQLTGSEVIRILVGQQGSSGGASAGGGGGTFVVRSPYNTAQSILLIAGGGGGGADGSSTGDRTGTPGTTANNGTAGRDGLILGGSNGSGGGGTSGAWGGAGGGGFTGSGGLAQQSGASISGSGGSSFTSGGSGGISGSSYPGDGGFGAGGGSSWGAGGGGGYSGGGADNSVGNGNDKEGGGGGGSFNSGSNQSNSSGVKSGHGLVTITKL